MSARAAPARKRFGQHFLEAAWVAKLVDALDARPGRHVSRDGPGRGALTVPLAARVKRVLAVEIDRDLAAALPLEGSRTCTWSRPIFSTSTSPTSCATTPKPVRVVGNLPYNVASPSCSSCCTMQMTGASCATPR